MQFYVDIESTDGTKYGSGPLASVSRWQYTSRFDRAGNISFDFAGGDEQAAIVQPRRIARAYALIDDVWTEVGAGVIDSLGVSPDGEGRVSLSASGLDLIRELSYRTVGNLEIGAGSGATHSAALTAIEAFAPAGWTFTPAVSPDNDYIYARYGGESVLGALVHLAERTQTHFYRSTNRTLVFTSAFTSSGVRAIQAKGDLVAETCAIVSLRQQVDTYDLLTRITPYGSGTGDARLTLAATSRAAPSGYTLSAANNYIENTAATVEFGLVNFPQVEFKEITPISNTDADLEAAADMLFDAALEELQRRSTLADQRTYTLRIAGCSQLLRPMQTIRIVYRDLDQGVDIDEELYILEATWEVDESGIYTSDLVVSTDDRWPVSDVDAAADRAVEGRVFQAHPQMNANSYVTAYNKNVDVDQSAYFRFRFGAEVVNLQQVSFEFQLLDFESTVRSFGATSGTTTSGGGATPTSSSDTGHTHTVTIAAHDHTVSVAAHTHTVTVAAHDHTVTVAGHTHSVTVADHTHGITIPDHSHGVTIDDHSHDIAILDTSTPGSPSMEPLFFDRTNDLFAIGHAGTDTFDFAGTTEDGGGDSVTSANGGSVVTSTASGGAQTPTSSSGGSQTPTSSSGGGQSPTSSSGGSQTPTSSSGGSSAPTSSGGSSHSHTVTISAHTHDLTASVFSVYGIYREDSANTYDISELEYRVNGGSWADLDTATDESDGWYALDITDEVQDTTTFRPLQTNNLLEIRAKVEGSLAITYWEVSANELYIQTSTPHGLAEGDIVVIDGAALGTAFSTDIDGQYTVTVIDSTTIFRVELVTANDTNTADAGTVARGKTATIDAQLSVRNTIQAIAYI